MKKKSLLLILLLVTSISLGITLASGAGDHSDDDHSSECTVSETLTIKTADGVMGYEKDEYQVKKNTCYELIFQNTDDEEHDLRIPADSEIGFEEVHLHLENNTAGEHGDGTASTTFMTPDEDTEFTIYCSVEGHRSQGMEALLVVGEGNQGLLPTSIFPVFLAFIFMISIPMLRKK